MRKITLLVLGTALQGAVVGCSSSLQVEPTRPGAPVLAADASHFDAEIAPFFSTYCTSCHTGAGAPEGIALDFESEEEAREKALDEEDFWTRVVRNVSSKQMPPPYAEVKPSDEERVALVDWISNNVLTANGMPDPGPFMVRRLNNREYANTVRDFLYLPADFDLASDFPADERGDGFDNNSATLTISPLLIESYLAAAEKATVQAMGLDPKMMAGADSATRAGISANRRKIQAPSDGLRLDFGNWQLQARLNLETHAARAFRRPVTDAEIEELMKFAALSFAHNGESRDEATALALRAALLSPDFLFRIERDPNPDGTGKVFEITEYQLASRLSYFLWSTMPDDSLFITARDGTLRETLDEQVARMLADPKAISLTKDFLGQWLEIRGIGDVDNVSDELLQSMLGETEHFFDYIVRNDRSIMEFLDADYTFVDERLAEHYGIPGVTGEEFQKVAVDKTRRGGIFTQASFLTLTSKPLGNGMRTSPVMRGKWILENIFNEEIPPPPPNVPSLNIDPNAELKGTVRQIFEQHRADPVCAGCHARMDPYGFALENYDGTGRWREQDSRIDVDASGEINGKKFTTPVEFRAILADRQDDFRVAVVRKMLSYALGRGMLVSDRSTVEQIATAVKADGDRFSSLIINIAKSYPFQHARASAGATTEVFLADASPTGVPPVLYHPVRIGGIPDSLQAPLPTPRPQQGQGQAQGQQRQGQQGQAQQQGQQGQGQPQGQGQGRQDQGQNAAPDRSPAPAQTPSSEAGQTPSPLPGTVRTGLVDTNREERP